jgi:hypothetical protein
MVVQVGLVVGVLLQGGVDHLSVELIFVIHRI